MGEGKITILELDGAPIFSHVLVCGLRPREPAAFQRVLERLGAVGSSVQLMDARGVAGWEHIKTAAHLAAKSFRGGRNLARSPATEILLYASARRQIKEAIERLGVGAASRSWVLLAVSDSAERLERCSALLRAYGSADDRVIGMALSKRAHLRRIFGISEEELSLAKIVHGDLDAALVALVVERVALSELFR